MLTALPVPLAVGASLVGGVFFAFSTFVMKALSQLPAEQGIAADGNLVGLMEEKR